MSRTIALVSLLAVVAACGMSGFRQPAAGSYEMETRQFTTGDAATASLPGASVTKDFFPGTNAQPLLGRFLIDGDFVPAAPASIVLSDQLWTERFDAASTIIGRTIEIDGHRWVVVGIAPSGFDVPSGAQFWTPKKS